MDSWTASSLRLTDRVVRYNLPSVEAYLSGHGLRLVKRRGVGIWIDGDSARRTKVVDDLATAAGPAVPLAVPQRIRAVSSRVAAFAWDPVTWLPALDWIALRPGE